MHSLDEMRVLEIILGMLLSLFLCASGGSAKEEI